MRRAIVAALGLVAMIACLAAFWGVEIDRRPAPPNLGPGAGVVSVEFLDVGQGDAILIRSPEGKTALIDAGPSNRVVDLLRERGVRSLDLVAVSHHHQDHYGGMAAVIRAFRPRAFLDADSLHVTANYVALLKVVKAEKMMAIRAGPEPRKIDLGSVRLTTLPLGPLDDKNENNNSIGLLVEYGGFSALLTGDSEGPERRWWSRHAARLCANVDVLKLAHHGSHNGTDARWLALTSPRLAVASLGASNLFGHPARSTLALVGKAKIPLLRTDQDGSIRVQSDGRTFSISTPARASRRTGGRAPTRQGGGRGVK